MNTFDLSLDLDKRAGVTQLVTMRQGDHDGTQLRATIYDHGTQVSDSYTCRVSIRKPTDNEYYRETCSFSGGVAIVTIDEQYAASEVGITYGYFELLQGTAVIASTENFGVRILQSAIDGAIVAPPYDSAIEDALAELDEATGRISQMVIDATAEYLEAHPEITTTVQDNSLTDAKLVQKGGILQREQWLETMLPNIPRKATAEADVHSVTDSAGGGPLGIEVYGRSTQDGTPTPDAPVPIQSVTPNLYDSANETGRTNNGVTWTATADGIRAVGTASNISYLKGNPSALTDADMTFLPAGTYTVTNHDGATMAAWVYVGSVSSATQVRAWSADAGTTFTVPDGGGYFRISLRVASGATVDTTYRVSLTAGSEAAAGFVPYGCAGLWAKGRNLLDKGASVSGKLNLNGTVGSSTWALTSGYIPVVGGTSYYAQNVLGSSDGVTAAWYDGGMGFISTSSVSGTRPTGGVLTAPQNAKFVRLDYGTTEADVAQLQVGSTATPYKPYTSVTIPIDLGGRSLRSLPDGTRDEVVVDAYGHAQLIQRVFHVTLDGVTYKLSHTTGGYCSGAYSAMRQAPNSGAATWVQCDHFPRAVAGDSCYLVNKMVVIRYGTAFAPTSQAELDAWFQANPTTVEFARETPVTIDLGHLEPALLPAPDLTAYVVPSAPSVLRYGFDVAAAIAEIATS